MAFEKFVGVRTRTPKVSITKQGLISLNQPCLAQYAGEKRFAVLFFDVDAEKIGIEFTTNKDAEGAYTVRARSTGADISAKAFLKWAGIEKAETHKYEPTQGKQGMLIINLQPRKGESKDENIRES